MFRFFKKLDSIERGQTEMAGVLSSALDVMTKSLTEMRVATKHAAARDSKYFQALMQENLVKPHSRVYALLYLQAAMQQRRLVLASADMFEKAREASDAILRQEGIDTARWIIEGFTHIDLPPVQEKSPDVSSVLSDAHTDVPMTTYIMNLQLARDKFAADKKEKVVLTNIINRIKETHGTIKK